MRYIYFLLCASLLSLPVTSHAQTADELFQSLRKKATQVNDYVANVKMKIDVAYMRVPLLKGKLYFKAPNKMRLERQGGISILPKKNINLTLSNLMPTGNATVIDMGMADWHGQKRRVLKVVPDDDKNIVLAKLWVDPQKLLVEHIETTTLNDGTVIMDLLYNRYIKQNLPDKVKIFMDLKDYKLPASVTMDYGDTKPAPKDVKKGPQKGTIEIDYLDYSINKGVPDNVFTDK